MKILILKMKSLSNFLFVALLLTVSPKFFGLKQRVLDATPKELMQEVKQIMKPGEMTAKVEIDAKVLATNPVIEKAVIFGGKGTPVQTETIVEQQVVQQPITQQIVQQQTVQQQVVQQPQQQVYQQPIVQQPIVQEQVYQQQVVQQPQQQVVQQQVYQQPIVQQQTVQQVVQQPIVQQPVVQQPVVEEEPEDISEEEFIESVLDDCHRYTEKDGNLSHLVRRIICTSRKIVDLVKTERAERQKFLQ